MSNQIENSTTKDLTFLDSQDKNVKIWPIKDNIKHTLHYSVSPSDDEGFFRIELSVLLLGIPVNTEH